VNKKRSFYFWTRKLHLYLGLFIGPHVLIFALSTLYLNHGWRPGAEGHKRTVAVEVTEGLDRIEQAKRILDQLDQLGEINMARLSPEEKRLRIVAVRPGARIEVNVDLSARTAEIEERPAGIVDAMVFLHFNPGPHRVRGPTWIFTRIWRWLADTFVYILLFVSISGIYLWAVIKAERRAGLILIGLGCISFFALAAVLLMA
jgi:hypothetical protein